MARPRQTPDPEDAAVERIAADKASGEARSRETAAGSYTAASISILRGLTAVQKRPGMYIGDVSSVAATHHLLYEIFDNAVDEGLAGHATTIEVTLHGDGSASVADDGRGVPVDIHPEEGISAAEVIYTSLHAGGKFDNDSYKFSGGLHGVGAAVTNALSDWLTLDVVRDGGVFAARFEKGETVSPIARQRKAKPGEATGTRVRFHPSATYLRETRFERETLARRFREVAFLNAGLRIVFADLRAEDPANMRDLAEAEAVREVMHYDGGLAAFAEEIAGESPLVGELARFEGRHEGVEVDLAFGWMADDRPEDIRAYTNNIPQADGGQHVTGLRAALVKALTSYGDREKLIRRGSRMTPEDLREGLACALHVRIGDPAFSSQTKEKLISVEARTAVEAVVGAELPRWLDERPETARAIIQRAQNAAEAREAAKKARELSRTKVQGKRTSSVSLPEKLADCSSKLPELRELYLVEGDSAGGSAKQARDRETQAILPLRGKILNVERAKPVAIMKNAEVVAMVQTLGSGIGKAFDLKRLRYGKIVIMTDADVDGAHIATLILTFFFRQMPELVEAGHLFLATPPLYRVRRKGEEDVFVQSDAELASLFVGRALAAQAWEIDGNAMEGAGAMAALKALIEAAELAPQVAIDLKHPALADALLGTPDADFLFGQSAAHGAPKPSAAAVRRLLRDLGGRLTELDPDGSWTLDVISGPTHTHLLARRLEDGVETRADLAAEDLSGWRIARLRRAARDAGLLDAGAVTVAGSPAFGPIGLLDALRAAGSRGAMVSRYKGLGEMNPEELWSTTMDPTRRVLRKVSVLDAEIADRAFQDLMADNVGARRELIEKMCAGATRLDV